MRSTVRRVAVNIGLATLVLLALFPGFLPDRTHPAYLAAIVIMAAVAAGNLSRALDGWLDRWVWIPTTVVSVLMVMGTGGATSHFRVGFLVVGSYVALATDRRTFLAAGMLLSAGALAPLAYDTQTLAGATPLLVDWIGYVLVAVAIRLLATHAERLREDVGQHQRSLTSLYDDGPLPMVSVSLDGTVTRSNRATSILLGRQHGILGQQVVDIAEPGPERTALQDALDAAAGGSVASALLKLSLGGVSRDIETTVVPRRNARGDVEELLAFGRDVSERRHAELVVARRANQHSALAQLGLDALTAEDLDTLLQRAADLMVEALPADDGSVMVPVAGGNAMSIRAYAGDDPAQWRDRTLPTQGSLGGHVFATGEPISSDDFQAETRFPIPSWLMEAPLRSGVAVLVPTADGPWGVLAAACAEPRHWSPDDLAFVQNVANVIGSTVERHRATRRLRDEEARYRQIADNVHDVVFRIRLQPEPRLTYVSPSVEGLLGRQVPELLEQTEVWFQTLDRELLEREHPDGTAPVDQRANERIPLRHVDGHVVWLDVRRSPVLDESGRVVGIDGIARDITDEHRAREVLEDALAKEQRVAAELRKVDEMRDNFLAAVSHELRTPLAGVLGFAMTLEDSRDRMDERQVGLLLHRLSANAQRLDSLLADLLDLDRLRRSVLEPGRRNIDLGALVHRVARTRGDVGDRLVVEAPSLPASVDPPMVERIVENLLGNALKHAGPNATVWLRAEVEDDDVLLRVEDDGPGIPVEHREMVFRPFEQGDHDHAHAPGTGIGLSLVAQFAEVHGGRAWVTERRGGGASFRVRLPGAHLSDGQALDDEATGDQPRASRSPQRGQKRASRS